MLQKLSLCHKTSWVYAVLNLIIVLAAVPAFSQSDSTAQNRLDEAFSLYEENNLEEARLLFSSLAGEHCEGRGDLKICLESILRQAIISGRLNDLDAAARQLVVLNEYLDENPNFGQRGLFRTKLWRQRLLSADKANNMEEARTWSEKLREVSVSPDAAPMSRSIAHNTLGYHEDTLGNYDAAIYHFEQVTELASSVDELREIRKLLISTYNNMGISYRKIGELEKARNNYELSLELILELHGKDHVEVARTYNNIGAVYYVRGDIGQAAEYFRMSAEKFQNLYGPNHLDVAGALNNLASCYFQLSDFEKSARYLERAQRIKESTLGPDHLEIAVGYSNLAAIHILNDDLELAEKYYAKSIEVRENIFGSIHPDLILPKILFGDFYAQQLNDFERARVHYRSALAITTERLGDSHPDVPDILLQIAKTYIGDENFWEAQKYLDRTMKKLYGHYSFENDIDLKKAISQPIKLTEALKQISRLHKEKENQFNRQNYLRALQPLEWAMELIDEIQKSFKNDASKLRLVDQNYTIYTSAIEISAALYEHTENPVFKEKIFEFIEKSRARLALELIRNVDARSFAGVPQEIIEEESALNSEITGLQQNLFQEQQKGSVQDSVRVSSLSQLIFQKKRELDNFVESLEESYPSYYILKHDMAVADLEAAKRELKEDETLLSYVLGPEKAFAMVITSSDSELVGLGSSEMVEIDVEYLRDSVLRGDVESYKEAASDLYLKLMEPLTDYISGDKILIMADQGLHYLPFEMLLTERPDHSQFHKMPFLLREFTTSYIPSTTLFRVMNKRKPASPRNLLAIAPFIEEEQTETGSGIEREMYQGDTSPLLLTKYETTRISEIFLKRITWSEYLNPQRTEVLTGADATLNRFSELNLTDYSFIHFATHAYINEDDPAYSGILLHPGPDNPGVAYVGDIYNMQLSADLVVLGACETGLGSIHRGEGLIGFTRAFIYAGASNLVVSMWRVSDQPTAFLMIDFYDFIRQGYDYSEAMRKAKLSLIEKPHLADPVNWAAFILNGR